MYSGCCVALPLSYLQRLLCGIAPILFAALAGMAPILFAALAVWHCPYPICSACCVASPLPICSTCCEVLLLSYVQWLLCGFASILFVAPAMWSCSYLLLSYVQGLLGGIALILFLLAALAVWSCFNFMFSGCCVALPLSYLQRLRRGPASTYLMYSGGCVASPPRLFAALAVWSCLYLMYCG